MSAREAHDLPATARVRAAPDQVSSDTGGEFVILGLETGRYHGVDGVAARIWALVQRDTTVAEIERTISEEYDVDPARAAEDVRSFLEELRSRRLVVVDDAPGA